MSLSKRTLGTIRPYLIILRRELVQTLLNDMVPVQVLDEHDDMKAKSDDDGMNLAMVSMISLRRGKGHPVSARGG